MPAGRKRHFTRSSFRAHAVAITPAGSEIVDVSEEPLWDRGNVNATLTRKEKGAVLEFIVIEAFDTAAFGRVVAKAPELDLTAEYRALDRKYLPIPLDTNDNRIADAWEMKVLGHLNGSRDLDDETARLQDTKGDGITLFNEYRGVVVLENGRRVHKRLDPHVKELFVLDPATVVPSDLWKRLAHMQVVRVDESLVDAKSNAPKSPLVNFNASDHGTHPFYAVRVRKVDGDYDADAPDGYPKSTEDPILPKMAYINMPDDGIRGTEYIKVFPDRVRMLVARRAKWIEDGLANPTSETGKTLRDPANGFTTADAAAALAVLKTAEGRENVIRRILDTLFIHELGHACGDLPDHEPSREPGYKPHAADAASRQCLMHIPETFEFRRMIVLTALGRGDPDLAFPITSFCNFGPRYACARMLSTRNW